MAEDAKGGRPYRLGKKKTSQAEFDQEVLRLVKLGLREKEIAERLKCSRWTVGRSLKRVGSGDPTELHQAKQEGEYKRLSHDEFLGLPELQPYIENMKARGVRHWKNRIFPLKKICDDLQIYPSQLDMAWAQKWLASQNESTMAQLRPFKVCLRVWQKFMFKASDSGLSAMGLDAKHYETGKWAMVTLSENQIAKAESILHGKALLVFRLGVECCTPYQELERLKKSDYSETTGILRTFRGKTGSFWSKYPSKESIALLLSMPNEQVFTHGDFDDIHEELRECYKAIEANSEYFFYHPIHALRHVGCQRLLRMPKINYNRAVVAVLGGWEAEKTLEDHYGAVPDDIIHRMGSSLWQRENPIVQSVLTQ